MISINDEIQWKNYVKVIEHDFKEANIKLGKIVRIKGINGNYYKVVIQEGINLIYLPDTKKFKITSSKSRCRGAEYNADDYIKKIELFKLLMKDVTL